MIKFKDSAVLLITLLFLFVCCQPEEEPDPVPAFEPVAGATTLAEEPGLQILLTDFLGTSHQGRTESAEAPFGTLDYSEITEFLGSEYHPAENYTIRLMPPEGVQSTREYLHLIADADGYRGYIVQYIAADSDSSLAFSQSSFTGTINALNLQREVQAVNLFENGVEINDDADKADENGREETDYYNCQCHYELADDDGIAWGPVTGTPIDTGYEGLVYVISCVCDQAPTFDNPNLGGGGISPIGDPIDGGGFGGSSGSPGFDNGDYDGEPDGPVLGDPVAVLITDPVPADIAQILQDTPFMEAISDLLPEEMRENLGNPDYFGLLRTWYAIWTSLEAHWEGMSSSFERKVAIMRLQVQTYFNEADIEDLHVALDLAGFVPVLGEGPDGVNGIIYVYEGDNLNAGFSFISIIPVAGDAVGKGAKYTIKIVENTKVGKVVVDYFRSLPLAQITSVLRKFTEVPVDRMSTFFGDMISDPSLLRKYIDDPDLVDGWKKLDELGADKIARKNADNLGQAKTLSKHSENISDASNARKGNFGEIGADLDLNLKGYESLQPRITDIDAPGHNGIDGVYRAPDGGYIIVEGKYTGSAKLNPANPDTDLPRQMSDAWIRRPGELASAVGDELLARTIISTGYKRVLAKVAPDGSVSYQLINADGYVITGIAGNFIP